MDRAEPDIFIVSARLKSGAFESSIEVPLPCSKKQQDDFVAAWLQLMATGIKMGQNIDRQGPVNDKR